MTSYCDKLKAACRAKPIEFLALVVTFLAFVSAGVGVYFVYEQLAGLTEALESQAYSYIDSNQLSLDRLFIENSKYRPYFNDGVAAPPINGADPATREMILQIWSIADFKLDTIDAFYSQADHINWKTRYTRQAWEQYYQDSFDRSPVLCERICLDWMEYGVHVRAAAKLPGACGKRIEVVDLPALPGATKTSKASDWSDRPEKCTWKTPDKY